MTGVSSPLAAIPSHVPAELVFDFDLHADPRLSEDTHKGYMSLHSDAPDIFFTPRNGGHWVVTRYDDLVHIMRNEPIFSTVMTVVPAPPAGTKMPVPPLDMADPEHRKLRVLLNKFLQPSAVNRLESDIRSLCVDLIKGLVGDGGCEFVHQFSMKLPVLIFMRMMQWDSSRYLEFVEWVHIILGVEADAATRMDYLGRLDAFLSAELDRIEAHPGGKDPLSRLMAARVDGKPLGRALVKDMGKLLFTAGLDTVTNAMSYIARHLAEHPDDQQLLREHPERIPDAIEELMRRVAFVNTGRQVACDTVISGVTMKKGDLVLTSLCAASNDPRRFACPAHVDLERQNARQHVAFNTGPHNCAGVHLAKLELRVWLEEWLLRVPPFRLDPARPPSGRAGQTMGLNDVHLLWNPDRPVRQ
jgi:cytochrome P450